MTLTDTGSGILITDGEYSKIVGYCDLCVKSKPNCGEEGVDITGKYGIHVWTGPVSGITDPVVVTAADVQDWVEALCAANPAAGGCSPYMSHSEIVNLIAGVNYVVANPFPVDYDLQFVQVTTPEGVDINKFENGQLYWNLDVVTGEVIIRSDVNLNGVRVFMFAHDDECTGGSSCVTKSTITVSTVYTAGTLPDIILIDATLGSIDITLPIDGCKPVVLKIIGDPNGSSVTNTIDGILGYEFFSNSESIKVISDGVNLHRID